MRPMLRILLPICLLAALACGGGGSGATSSAGTPTGPSGTPYSPPWAETPADPYAPSVPDAWRTWVEQHHLPLACLDPTEASTSDFQPWAASLAGKNVVFLGESSHGTGDYSAVKVRAIRFLHEQMGFDVMVFESSLFALHVKDKTAATEDPVHLMQNSIFGVWNTAETAELFRYIQTTRSTAHPLLLAGMDPQISSYTTDRGLGAFVDAQLSGQDPLKVADADAAVTRTQEILDMANTSQQNAALMSEGPGLSSRLYAAAAWMDTIMPALVAASSDARDPLIARQALWSRARYVDELVTAAQADDFTSHSVRDDGMAQNLIYLAEKVYPGRKLMVWCHNAHAENHTDDLSLYNGYWSGYPSTGTLAKAHFGSTMYTVGLFMYRGATNLNNGTAKSVIHGSVNGLEAALYCTRRKAALVELKDDAAAPGSAWIRTYIPCLYWGYLTEHMVPQSQFDAILFVDTTHPAVYLPLAPAAGMSAPAPPRALASKLADGLR